MDDKGNRMKNLPDDRTDPLHIVNTACSTGMKLYAKRYLPFFSKRFNDLDIDVKSIAPAFLDEFVFNNDYL